MRLVPALSLVGIWMQLQTPSKHRCGSSWRSGGSAGILQPDSLHPLGSRLSAARPAASLTKQLSAPMPPRHDELALTKQMQTTTSAAEGRVSTREREDPARSDSDTSADPQSPPPAPVAAPPDPDPEFSSALFGGAIETHLGRIRVARKNKWRAWVGAVEAGPWLDGLLENASTFAMPAGDHNTKIVYGGLMEGDVQEKIKKPRVAVNYQRRPTTAEETQVFAETGAGGGAKQGFVPNYSKLFLGASEVKIQTPAEESDGNAKPPSPRISNPFTSFRVSATRTSSDEEAPGGHRLTFPSRTAVADFVQARLCHWADSEIATDGVNGLKFHQYCTAQEWDVVSSFIKSDRRWRDCDDLPRIWRRQVEEDRAQGIPPTSFNIYMDVGGNLGACVFKMLTDVEHRLQNLNGVFVFEPHPVNLFRLTSTMSRLPEHLRKKVVVFPVGLGRAGNQEFSLQSESGNLGNSAILAGASASGAPAGPPLLPSGGMVFMRQKIFVESLEAVFGAVPDHVRIPAVRVPLLKLDIQGSECNFLRGATGAPVLQSVARVKTEVDRALLANQGCSLPELSKLWVERGYCLARETFEGKPRPRVGATLADLVLRRGGCAEQGGGGGQTDRMGTAQQESGMPCACAA